MQTQNRYLDFLSFQGVNGLFVLSFEECSRKSQAIFPSNQGEKRLYVMMDGRIFFDQPVKIDLRTNDNIRKIVTGQGGDYTTRCLLDYPHFKKCWKLIAKDLSKQQKLDADLKAIQQINFTGSLEEDGDTQIFFISEEAKKSRFRFFFYIISK